MRSKQKPKKLTLYGSDGREYIWLVKHESRGDLRKDTRLMEVTGYLNRWLGQTASSRQKNLQVKLSVNYASICTNEIEDDQSIGLFAFTFSQSSSM